MGKASPLILDLTVQSPLAGTVSFVSGGSTSQSLPYRFDGPRFIADMSRPDMKVHMEGALAIGETEYTLTGPLSSTLDSNGQAVLKVTGTFNVAKPVPAAG